MKVFLFFLFALFPTCLFAQMELNLRQCRKMALQSSKEMDIAGQQQRKAVYDLKAYRADYLPKVSATALGIYSRKKYDYTINGGYLPTYKPGENGSLEPNVVVDPTTQQPVTGVDGKPVFNLYAFLPDIRLQLNLRGVYTGGVQLEQPIYMGGKVRAAVGMAKVGENIADGNVRLSRSEVLFETDAAYWQTLRVDEQVVAAAKYREVVLELWKSLKNSESVGMATMNDVLKAQVRCNEAGLMLQKAQNGRRLARMNLCRLIGLNLQTELCLQDSLTETLDAKIWMLDSAVSQRADYSMLVDEVALKGRQIALTRSDFLPQVGVTAGYSYSGGLKLNGKEDVGTTFSAMAAVHIPVFHWGEGRNKVRSARMEEEISRLKMEKSKDLMQLEIASNRFSLKDAVTRVEMVGNALLQAKENLNITTNQYKVGMENLTALLDAQAQWQQAWSEWVDAKALLHLSESAYLKAIGKLELLSD
ncbi:MAG: TolC family protein [Odoribacter sp.]